MLSFTEKALNVDLQKNLPVSMILGLFCSQRQSRNRFFVKMLFYFQLVSGSWVLADSSHSKAFDKGAAIYCICFYPHMIMNCKSRFIKL